MSKDTQVTPPTEEIVDAPGTVESIGATAPATEPETVPLATYLSQKDDAKEEKRKRKTLEKEVERLKAQPSTASSGDVKALADKYDVDPSFISDILATATTAAEKKISEKYSSDIESIKSAQSQKEFDKKLDTLFKTEVKALKEEGFEIPEGVDEAAIKALAVANNKVPIRDLLKRLYPEAQVARSSSENDTRPAMDIVESVVDVHNLTKEQERKILSDPKARQKYFDMKDGIR